MLPRCAGDVCFVPHANFAKTPRQPPCPAWYDLVREARLSFIEQPGISAASVEAVPAENHAGVPHLAPAMQPAGGDVIAAGESVAKALVTLLDAMAGSLAAPAPSRGAAEAGPALVSSPLPHVADEPLLLTEALVTVEGAPQVALVQNAMAGSAAATLLSAAIDAAGTAAGLGARARALLAAPQVANALAALPARGLPLLPASVAGSAAALAVPLAAIAAATTEAVVQTGIVQLTALLRAQGAEPIVALANALGASNAAAPGSLPLAFVPPYQQTELRRDGATGSARRADRSSREEAAVPLPSSDPRGRAYTSQDLVRLRALGRDPRRGFAPEAQAALAAERDYALQFRRAPGVEHDFIDAAGRMWDVVAGSDPSAVLRAIVALGEGANVIVSLAAIRAEPHVVASMTAHLSNAGLHRVAIVLAP